MRRKCFSLYHFSIINEHSSFPLCLSYILVLKNIFGNKTNCFIFISDFFSNRDLNVFYEEKDPYIKAHDLEFDTPFCQSEICAPIRAWRGNTAWVLV